jgi:hypothetical protein
MPTRDELVKHLEQIDGAIEVLRTAAREKEAERVQVISDLGGRPEAPSAPQVASPAPEPEHTWFGTGGPVQTSDRRSYSGLMVHRNELPNHLQTHVRMHQGRYEAHLLPNVTVRAFPPADRPSLCGVTSEATGMGSSPWEPVTVSSGSSHVEVCRDCMAQLEQLERAHRAKLDQLDQPSRTR